VADRYETATDDVSSFIFGILSPAQMLSHTLSEYSFYVKSKCNK